MTTEQKIREAYEKAVALSPYIGSYLSFEAGYLALLNSLEPFVQYKGCKPVYRLPEGVTRP